ncbi:antitoxin [Flexivirga sp. ID2601S]|uniref:Antitoxin n=1 Tax=Flexivirga aerilata TaxID=1656889 RepID=A0A849AIS7_9MICO|nr:antitoxin [Flexivirga aerilata]NNG39456.1 antitoxin [Flexivirga aerilata]
MGLFDSAKDKASEFAGNNPDKVGDGIDKAGDFVDDKTGGQYADKVDQGQDFAKDKFGGGAEGNAEDQQQQ